MISNTTPAPLARLREQFDQCRGIGKRAVFPDELKLQTLALLDEFSPGIILQALNLSPTSLSRWRRQLLTPGSDNKKTLVNDDISPFISLPAVESCVSDKYPLTLVLGCADSDEKVTLRGVVTLKQWQDVLVTITKALLP